MLANTETYKNATTSIFVSIDGNPVSNPQSHWEVSDVFSGGIAQPGTALVKLYNDYGYNIEGKEIYPSLVSGYYAMLTGLSAGAHTITYGGATDAFGPFDYQVTATINVLAVPEPETYGLLLAGLVVVRGVARRRISGSVDWGGRRA